MTAAGSAGDWQDLLRRYKEKLAERLWSLPSVSETEKQIAFKELLMDLSGLESDLLKFQDARQTALRLAHDENDLLRSLMGISEDEMRAKSVSAEMDLKSARAEIERIKEENEELARRSGEWREENEVLRARIHELETSGERQETDHLKRREDDLKLYGEAHEELRGQLKDLETRLTNLKEIFTQTNRQLVADKQEEITLLQKKLLDEMEGALQRKQELVWAEQEMFAKGVAHRVRTALVSAQGQLFLTLEQLGLLDPETKTEAFWKARLRLLMEGGSRLTENFRAVQSQLHDVTSALDDYLHLTHQKPMSQDPVLLKDVVQREISRVYADRQPTLALEFLPDDPLPAVAGDGSMLGFIVGTLLENALEALPNGAGKVVIALKNLSDRGRVKLVVRDSGSGIPAHLSPRLFQPFFTTKEHRQGLSLNRAKRYAELHGGSLQLLQTGDGGTTFELELPLRPPASARLPLRAAEGR